VPPLDPDPCVELSIEGDKETANNGSESSVKWDGTDEMRERMLEQYITE